MNRRQKIIVSVTGIFLVLLIIVGLTYAYFLTQIRGNTNEKSISVETANLALKYDDGNGVLTASSKLVPNTTVSKKTFSVENTGDTTVDSYGVTLEDLEISYVNDFTDNNGNLVTAGTSTYLEYPSDFKIRITCESSDSNKYCNGYDGSMPSTNDVLLKNSIDEDEIHTYTLTLTYIDSGIDQSKDMNKTIEAKIDIIDTKGTIDVEGTVTNYVAGDYVQVNSEPKVSYINKDGKYKVVGLNIENHTISIYNGTTKKSFTTINVEKGETANVYSTNNTATVTNVERNITVDINASSGNYTLTKIDNGVKNGTPAYYAQLDELKVGDYVIYNYTPGTYTTTEVDDDGVSQSFDSSSDSIISSDKWRVLSVDGDVVQIIPDIREVPKLQMYGAKGYLNGPTVLNEMAEALYSGDMGTARSINAVDINKKVGYTGVYSYTKDSTIFTTNSKTLEELEQEAGVTIKEEYRKKPDGTSANGLKLNYYVYWLYDRTGSSPVAVDEYNKLASKKITDIEKQQILNSFDEKMISNLKF